MLFRKNSSELARKYEIERMEEERVEMWLKVITEMERSNPQYHIEYIKDIFTENSDGTITIKTELKGVRLG